MKIIYTSKNQEILVDDEWFESLSQYKWRIDSTGYPSTRLHNVNIPVRMHRMLLPGRRGFVVDHVDRNKLNNQALNLRYLPHYLNLLNTNARNVRMRQYRSTIVFQSRIAFYGKTYSFGCFPTHVLAEQRSIRVKAIIFDYFETNGKIPHSLVEIKELADLLQAPVTKERRNEIGRLGGIASGKIWTTKKIAASKSNLGITP